jgi:hypothetical protein
MFELVRTQAFTLPARLLPTANQSLAKHNRKPSQLIENNHPRPKSIASFCRVLSPAARSKSDPSEGGRSVADEEVRGHAQADGDYDPAGRLLVHFLCEVGARVAPGEAAENHQDGSRPENHPDEDECDHGDAVHHADQQTFTPFIA